MTQRMPSLEGAACATPLGRQLFSDVTDEVVDVCREICAACPVQRKCLQWGVLHERVGMWGGLIPEELKAERRRSEIRIAQPTVSLWTVLQQQAKRVGSAP